MVWRNGTLLALTGIEMKQFYYPILIGLVLVVANCSNNNNQPAAQAPCGFVQNVYGQRVSLKNGPPIKLY